MKIVVCENCGAKYQIDNDEDVDDYECSVCAGNLQPIQNYPSTNSQSNQNHGTSLYKTYNSNSQIVRCKNCGLKYNIGTNETLEDYECSSCFGELCYVDEELNKKFEEELKLKKSSPIENENHENSIIQNNINNNQNKHNINNNQNKHNINNSQNKHNTYSQEDQDNQKQNIAQNQNFKSQQLSKTNVEHNTDSNIISPLNETNMSKIEKKLRRKIEGDFSYSLKESYGDSIGDINKKNIENAIKKQIEEENSKESIFDKISKKNKEGYGENQIPENIAIDKEIAELNNASKSELDKINEALKKSNKKQDLIPHPNIKNTSYHDVYIVAGLIVALIGVSDVLLSQRVYGIIFIGIGIVLFVIGLIKNKKYTATEKRGKIIREKLLTLPERFYVLYFVKVPNANYGINHVVVGSSGIFSIVSQSYNEKEDKEKTKTENENINLVAKSKLNDLTLFDDSENEDSTNNNKNRINNMNYLDEDNKNQTDEIKKIDKDTSEDIIIEDENNQNKNPNPHNNIDPNNNEHEKLNTSKNQTRFKFIEGQKRFDHNNKIKQKSIHLSEELINFLNENGLADCYVEPLVGFVNKDVAVINMPLTDEDLFLDELLQKIVHGKRQLDDATTHKVAVLLSQYSTECSS